MSPNSAIAHYRITAKLGEGGMGAVYRATDTKLNRDVAIKVLPESLAEDAGRMVRFEREAQVLASLNNPHIAAIYGVEERALILELVEGPTLADRLEQGPIPLDEAMPLIDQMISALEYAHEKGVIHRDLKPDNIKITTDGRVKLLDFGLAKAMAADVTPSGPASSATITIHATMAGTILGTAAYMPPEQARGQKTDKRADIWAFGTVVYEMLTASPVFAGDNVSDILALVLTKEVDFSRAPDRVRPLLRRCLERDTRKRLRDIGDARMLLEESADILLPPAVARPAIVPWIVAAVLTVVAAMGWWRATKPENHFVPRFSVDLGSSAVMSPGVTAAISPDGTRIAFVVFDQNGAALATRALNESRANVLTGTSNAYFPVFSPDGEWIAFAADQKLKKISVHGGAPITLSDAPIPRGAAWGKNGFLIACLDGRGLSRIPENGGTPRIVAQNQEPEWTYRWPQILPGGETVVFTSSPTTIDFEDAALAVVSLKTGNVKVAQSGGYFGRYLPTGHLAYLHRGSLFVVRFDPRSLQTSGSPLPLLDDVAGNSAWGGGNLDFSDNGTFVYLSGKYERVRPLAWLDAEGKWSPINVSPGVTPRLSPDGKRLALSIDNDISVYNLEAQTSTRITFEPAAVNRLPVWAPDGRHLVYAKADGGLWWTRADGSGQPQQVLDIPGAAVPGSFSPDGKQLAFHQNGKGTNRDIWILPLDMSDPDHPKSGAPQLFLATTGADVDPMFSPDGRWIAHTTNQLGVYQVYVRPADREPGVWQISTSPGRFPVWSRAGNQLFFENAGGRIMVVDYSTSGGSFVPGKPREWSNKALWQTSNLQNFDVAPDGKRLIGITSENSADGHMSTHVTFILNFFDEVQRRVR